MHIAVHNFEHFITFIPICFETIRLTTDFFFQLLNLNQNAIVQHRLGQTEVQYTATIQVGRGSATVSSFLG